MQELPKAYADILRWRDEGASDEEVAGRLGILPASVSLLVRVAEAKLVPLIRAEGAGHEHMRARSP
jgi:transcriptional regulator